MKVLNSSTHSTLLVYFENEKNSIMNLLIYIVTIYTRNTSYMIF